MLKQFNAMMSSGENLSSTLVRQEQRPARHAQAFLLSAAIAVTTVIVPTAHAAEPVQHGKTTQTQSYGEILRAQFIHETLDREGRGITTVTSGKNTGKFFFKGEVESVTPSEDESFIHIKGKDGKSYDMPFKDFASKKLIFTTSGIQIDPKAKGQGVSLEQFRNVLERPEASYADMMGMATQPDEVEKLYLHLYWNPNYEDIKDKTLAMTLADIGVNIGKGGQTSILHGALDSLGISAPRMQDPLSNDGYIKKINAIPAHQIVAKIAIKTAEYYASIVTKNPEKHSQNLDGWMNRASNIGQHPKAGRDGNADTTKAVFSIRDGVKEAIVPPMPETKQDKAEEKTHARTSTARQEVLSSLFGVRRGWVDEAVAAAPASVPTPRQDA